MWRAMRQRYGHYAKVSHIEIRFRESELITVYDKQRLQAGIMTKRNVYCINLEEMKRRFTIQKHTHRPDGLTV